MKGKKIVKKKLYALFLILCVAFGIAHYSISSSAASSNSWIFLNDYEETLKIHDTYQLFAFAYGKGDVTWKSSSSSVASVDTYGLVTAKKAGTAKITAKIRGAESVCVITVQKTTIRLNKTQVTLENGHSVQLTATTSNGTIPTYRSNKSSIAEIDETGKITAMKPGTSVITVKADGTTATCKVTVKQPTVQLNKSKVTLYRNQQIQLKATVSSGLKPTWKSSKSSVATVNEEGYVTAMKHGATTITVSIDGVKKTCQITVKQPTISLSASSIQLQAGNSIQLTASVSSGNTVVWSSSNSDIASISSKGKITAKKKGKATIYAKEDGVTVSCKVVVSG